MAVIFLLLVMSDSITLAGGEAPTPFLDTIVLVDGGFIGWSRERVWHWKRSGALIRSLGGKGEGPGEFTSLSTVFWDGQNYWCVDGSRLESTVFKNNGSFLFRQNLFFRYLLPTKDALFVVDISKITREMVTQERGHPPLLRELKYHVDPEAKKIVIEYGPHFRKATVKQATWGGFSFKKHWVVPHKQGWLVANQLENRVWFYERASILQEAAQAVSSPSQIEPRPLILKHWQSEDVFRPHGGRKWWHSQCRINHFEKANQALVVGYLGPDAEASFFVQHIQWLDAKSLKSLHHVTVNGPIIGADGGDVYWWEVADNGQGRVNKVVM